jgi:hypothetical protein
MKRSSKNRLTEKELFLFPGETLFDKVGRAVCQAGCLPRKELFEAWEVARRVRRRFRGGRIIDLACGHGLTAILLLLLDNTSPEARAIDQSIPPSAQKLHEVLLSNWPRLEGRIAFEQVSLESVDLSENDLVVSVHACGNLTDRVIDLATAAKARLAVLPCCHNLADSDQDDLQGWLDGPLAVDVARVFLLKNRGYKVFTQTIPAEITPKNRLLMAEPV